MASASDAPARWPSGTGQCFSYDFLRLVLGFVDVRCYASLSEGVAELRSHEGARGKARNAVEIAIPDFLHGVEVLVLDVAIELEAVVVNDRVDLMTQRFDDRTDPLAISLDDTVRLDREFGE
jgi:hypothetical protein